MLLTDARALLDAVRDGIDASDAMITAALRATGDIDCGTIIRGHRPPGSWQRIGVPSLLGPAGPFDGLLQ